MAGLARRRDLRRAVELPDAVVTKAYAPILISGAIGGLIIGGLRVAGACIESSSAITSSKLQT